MARAVYTSHATTWQLFTERSRIYRYLVFGMKFIEFISVVRAIYLVVIFVIAGCSNGNSYTATPPSLRPPHTRPDQPWMLNETKNWTTSFLLSCFSMKMKNVECRCILVLRWWAYTYDSALRLPWCPGQWSGWWDINPRTSLTLIKCISPGWVRSRARLVLCMAMIPASCDMERAMARWHLRDGQKTA